MAGSEKREQTLSKTVKTCGLMLKFAWSVREGRLFIVIKALMAVVNAGFSVIYTVIPGVIINELIDEARILISRFMSFCSFYLPLSATA
ncbi:MAG: hypothetical protein LUG88_01910 [Clostridia bacterium]|nr:hypothetical protein [Clostridia bacterium]